MKTQSFNSFSSSVFTLILFSIVLINSVILPSLAQTSNNDAATTKPETIVKKSDQPKTCKIDTDCYSLNNSLCIDNLCHCKFGFQPKLTGNTSVIEECTQFQCKEKIDCAPFGSNVSISCENALCACAKPENHIDTQTQKCVNFAQIKDQCSSNTQCGENFICSANKKCECNFNFELKGTECKPFECTKTEACVSLFKGHVECTGNGTTTKKCQCISPFVLDKPSQRCKLPIAERSVKCGSNDDCGTNTQCANGECRCLMGKVKDSKDTKHVNCEKFTCNQNDDCHVRIANETMCRKHTKTCECFPPNLYKLDPTSQTCVEVKQEVACNDGATCGDNAECIKGKCKCALGFVSYNQTTSGGKLSCEKFQCNYYEDECDEVFRYSRCSLAEVNSTCVCKSQFKLDTDSGLCIKEDNIYLVFGVIAVVGVILLGPLMFFSLKRMMCGSL